MLVLYKYDSVVVTHSSSPRAHHTNNKLLQTNTYLLVGDGGVADEVEAVGHRLQVLLHDELRPGQRAAEQACGGCVQDRRVSK